MEEIINIVLLTSAAGICIPLGGLLSKIERIRPAWLEREFRHFVIAFGGGILVGAIVFILVPEGEKYLNRSILVVPIVLFGGVVFFSIERYLGLRRREAPQFMATLLDYVPESIALGGITAAGSSSAILLSLLIGLQNLPEGFNSYRELIAANNKSKYVLLLMFSLVPLGPILGIVGWLFLKNYSSLLGAVMLFAAGGILYLIFQDIAPQSRLKHHWGPPLGAVLGFCLALLGDILVNNR